MLQLLAKLVSAITSATDDGYGSNTNHSALSHISMMENILLVGFQLSC